MSGNHLFSGPRTTSHTILTSSLAKSDIGILSDSVEGPHGSQAARKGHDEHNGIGLVKLEKNILTLWGGTVILYFSQKRNISSPSRSTLNHPM